MKPLALLVAALLMTPGGSGRAQAHPDFSGEWTRVDSAPERGSVAAVGDAAFRSGTMGSGWGSPVILRQDPARLVVEYPFFSSYDLQAPIRLVFALDGSESRNTLNIGHAELLLRSRAAWRGMTLVVTTLYPMPGGGATTTEVRQALTLQSPATLLVETTRTGVPGTAPSVTRSVYTKR